MKRNRGLTDGGRGMNSAFDDPDIVDLLGVLDPGFDDMSYWRRFHLRVVSQAGVELRRRSLQHATIADVVESWTRALVPIAALVAAIAGVMLGQTRTIEFAGPVGVEEVLIAELDGPALPDLVRDGPENLTFAADVTF